MAGDFVRLLGEDFVVTVTDLILADVVVGVSVAAVRQLRERDRAVGVVVRTSPTAVVEMLGAGADVAVVGTEPQVEIAARILSIERRLLEPAGDGPG